jgi:hypothetical protein
MSSYSPSVCVVGFGIFEDFLFSETRSVSKLKTEEAGEEFIISEITNQN